MTRLDKKAEERFALSEVLAAIPISIGEDEIEEGETPDFVMHVGGRLIGVEVTTFASGATAGRGAAEATWEALQRSSRSFVATRPHLRNVAVGLMFIGPVPAVREHNSFMVEVEEFLRTHADKLGETFSEYWPYQFSSPLMRRY